MYKIKSFTEFFKIIATIFLGVIFTLVFFEIILFAFSKLDEVAKKSQKAFSKKDKFVILALGESTTAPIYNFNMRDYSWPAYLEKMLNEQNLGKEIEVINKGKENINSNKILDDLEENIEKYKPDLTISMMGVNDYYGQVAYETSAEIKSDDLLYKLKTYKLIKFIIANVKEKNESKNKEKINCDNEESCIYLASIQNENDFIENELAIDFLNKALEHNPSSVDAMTQLGYRYMFPYYDIENNVIETINIFKNIPKNNLEDTILYDHPINSLVSMNSERNNFDRKWFKKVEMGMQKIKENLEKYQVKDADPFLMLAIYESFSTPSFEDNYYKKESLKNKQTVFYLEKALEIDPKNPHVFFEFARYHAQYNNVNEAEKFYLKVLELDAKDELRTRTLIELANIYIETNRQELASEIFEKFTDSGGMYIKNYQKLYEVLESKDINFIVAQYPMRSIKPLKTIFKNNDNVLLVDNEKSFKNLVKEKGYEQIFVDRFAGDFGHCTEKGNMFLAENILSVILKNWKEIDGN